jgi:hypothetical protein
MIRLGEAAPALQALRERMCDREIHSDDLPAVYVRLLYNLPDAAPIASRVDQLIERNKVVSRRAVR